MYNFLEEGKNFYNIFQQFGGDERKDYLLLPLKSQSIMCWSCRWEGLKAVYEQLEQTIGCFMQLSTNNDSKKYKNATSLLRFILDFDFVFGLRLPRVILMNTSNHNSYVQGTQVDVFSLCKNTKMTIETLKRCRNDNSCKNLGDLATAISINAKQSIKENDFFEFQYPKLPRF